MSDLIKIVEDSRDRATQVALDSISDLIGSSEIEVRDRILSKIAEQKIFFPLGWYDPPFGGVAVLFGNDPYDRLKFETLRDPLFSPSESDFYNKESVGIVYLSPIEKETGMIGDIGFTIYNGRDEKIKTHIRDCYNLLIEVANFAEVGQSFGDLYTYAMDVFVNKGQKRIGWMSTNIWKATNDDKRKINFGHTIPGSFDNLNLGNSFDEIKENIRTKRIFIEEIETFKIPDTCAFTLEARLTDRDHILPNTFFHFVVVFNDGKKKILANFSEIFIKTGMDYML
ncbi:MAG: hypothetical protein JWP09_929 [Candidatus Taylorbacteria bacterium]|nr:hypothetical protein [Candidatus Taylorbacteria bacterium]